jgi:hypothetical protein
MFDQLKKYFHDLSEADRDASEMIRAHGPAARQVVSTQLQQAMANGDTIAVQHLQRVASGIAAIERSSTSLLHH